MASRTTCWFAEGVSSQRDVVLAARQENPDVCFLVSHHADRSEILSTGHKSVREPKHLSARLSFVQKTIAEHDVCLLHAGRSGQWYEEHRKTIELCNVQLITGACSVEAFAQADDKVLFAQAMSAAGLPVVPSLRVASLDALQQTLREKPFGDCAVCVKPVQGMYGAGFWRLGTQADLSSLINTPEARRIPFEIYEKACQAEDKLSLVVMPYLNGDEYSIDILAHRGQCLCAVQRCKRGSYQSMECEGDAIALAAECVYVLQADGLVNVQLRKDAEGVLHLLEINLRPSGSIGYTLCTGINMPDLFVKHALGLLSAEDIKAVVAHNFRAVTVKPLLQAIVV